MSGDGPTDADLGTALRAGAAVYNVGEHHAAHDAWEDAWLTLESGAADERLLHGLIQFTAAVHHAHHGNWSGATGLAESAVEYLDGLTGEDARGVDVAAVCDWLRAFERDPERIERAPAPSLRIDGEAPEPGLLTLGEVALAAAVVAAEYDYDESVVADAVRFGREDTDPDSSREAVFLRDFVADAGHRAVIFDRLTGLVERSRREEEDVAGLFEKREE